MELTGNSVGDKTAKKSTRCVVEIQGIESKAGKQYLEGLAKNFLRLMKEIKPQVQKAPHRMNTKQTSHTLTLPRKLLKMKASILKA